MDKIMEKFCSIEREYRIHATTYASDLYDYDLKYDIGPELIFKMPRFTSEIKLHQLFSAKICSTMKIIVPALLNLSSFQNSL